MRRLLGCATMIALLVGAYFFVKAWNQVSTWGTGTGTIARQIERKGDEAIAKTPSILRQIARDPLRFQGKRATVTGRVRSATKIASNRNLYVLIEGSDRILVIDDKAAPKPYYPRTVTGVVQTIGPKIAGQNYAYLTDVKSGVKVDPPNLKQVQNFLTDRYEQAREGVREEILRR